MSFNVFLTGRLNINTFIGYKKGRETKCMLESTIIMNICDTFNKRNLEPYFEKSIKMRLNVNACNYKLGANRS